MSEQSLELSAPMEVQTGDLGSAADATQRIGSDVKSGS
jgi:hypothetical protein